MALIDSASASTGLKVRSGTGQYPALGTSTANFSDTYDHAASILASNTAYSEELQLVNGKYQTPGSSDGYKNYTTYYLFNGIIASFPASPKRPRVGPGAYASPRRPVHALLLSSL